ncbi:MAG: LutC/YkgG family protein [Actinomycetota bacterium]
MERSAFLARVRDRLAGVESQALPEALPQTFASGDGHMFERFAERLGEVGGEARRVRASDIEAAVAELAEGARTAVVAAGVGKYREAIEAGLRRARCESSEPSREVAATADLGITGAELAVASTGSVLVGMGPDAPRVASLLPPVHVVILPEERLVPGFEELFAALPEHARTSAQTVLITGPSRTGDIELALVRGVHGPMKVVVLVVAP